MTSEIQIFSKDKITLNILQEVLSGRIHLRLQLNNGAVEDYLTGIHENGRRVYVYGKFNISEAAGGEEPLTIRPSLFGDSLRIQVQADAAISGKKASVVRGATKSVEREYEISGGTSIELVPQEKQSYLLKISDGSGQAAPSGQGGPSRAGGSPGRAGSGPRPEHRAAGQESRQVEEVVVATSRSTLHDDRFQELGMSGGGSGGDDRFDSDEWNMDEWNTNAVVSGTGAFANVIPTQETEHQAQGGAGSAVGYGGNASATAGESDAELRRIEREISAVEKQQGMLSRKKQSALDHLEKIEAEYKKDYAAFERELEEEKSRMEADASVIAHYKDQDIVPIEAIFQEVRQKLDEAEKQIRLFVEARQRKTMEIESEIKSNKKQ